MTLRDSTAGHEGLSAGEFSNRWSKFRDALRHEDQLVWDEMWKAVDIHRDGNDFDKQFMTMMIENRKMDDEIDLKLTKLEQQINVQVNE